MCATTTSNKIRRCRWGSRRNDGPTGCDWRSRHGGGLPMNEAWSAWPAPAKLNLFLHLVGRRADGYHELETVFQLLEFGDVVQVRVRRDDSIVCLRGAPGVAPPDDLMLRAAPALKRAPGARFGAELALDKRVPIGAGLGGGSSDAATTLVVLNRLWGTGLDEAQLAALGGELGADVPLFVRGHSAYAQGIGDQLTALELDPHWFVILDPGIEVPTGPMFQAPELTRNSPHTTIPRFFAGDSTHNAFEPVVRARYKAVAEALDWLGAQAQARLTGTGGCVFAALPDENSARAIAATCPKGMRAFGSRGVNESPLRV